jgi:hypothetical protein
MPRATYNASQLAEDQQQCDRCKQQNIDRFDAFDLTEHL